VQLNIASHLEQHFVSRVEAFRDLYSRLLLEELGADAARVAALARDIDRAPRNNRTAAVVWDIAVELCQRAAEIIDTTGAATDASARRRRLAGTQHLNRTVALGQWIPAYQQQLDNELLQALRDPEPGPHDSSGQ
jgi:hypothetical protein